MPSAKHFLTKVSDIASHEIPTSNKSAIPFAVSSSFKDCSKLSKTSSGLEDIGGFS